ncbi:PLP-dependent aminotransferase family protein [Paenibacillus jilunlii]|uniref:GntR family transcriptional regulator n=1 Tax=Paenibacillus jilunlii TaxID=682956 RepID=A0A1G9UD90_9BACL|nr:PLP-dependent aminotransferase family protein [Paenibacillus jilunlii]KWX77879.1 GntR family transcriptional regulator [Paenibacillus jilunlii]SDM57889.1 transcriptional regulator, GntR family [Paenibacillus jilunlii]
MTNRHQKEQAPGRSWTPDPASALPLHRQISNHYMDKIRSGAWPPGMRLAPQRELCRQLGVNRSTVVTALGELAALGLIEGRRGGGTRVADLRSTADGAVSPGDRASASERTASSGDGAALAGDRAPSSSDGAGMDILPIQPAGSWNSYVEEGVHYPNLPTVQDINRLEYEQGLIRLGTGEPSPGLLPGEAMTRMLAELSRKTLPPLSYEEPLGSPGLRSAVSSELAKNGIQADPDSILITSGALQGLQLIAVGLLPRGSTILLEKPSYLYSIHAFQSAGVKFSGLPMDEHGLLTDRLAREARRTKAAMLYSIPSFHNPTGILMDAQRRQKLMDVTGGLGLPILEDGAYQELWLDTPPPLPLKALDREGRVLHLGTLSKSASPGLRIGWIVGPEPVVRRLADIKMQTDYGASSLSQLAAARWLEGGYHEEHLQRLRAKLRVRRDAALALLERHFAGLAAWNVPAGGFYIWLALDKPVPLRTLFRAAHKAGLLLNTGDLYDRGDSRHLRLSYVYASPTELETGLPILAGLIRKLRQPGS